MMRRVPDYRRQICRPNKGGCGKKASEVGAISWGGLCIECAKQRVRDNCDGLHTMSGPAVNRWRHGMAACVGAILPDDPQHER